MAKVSVVAVVMGPSCDRGDGSRNRPRQRASPGTLSRMGADGQRSSLTQLRRGALEYCVLALVADEERYAVDLVRDLGEVEALVTSEGTLYPLALAASARGPGGHDLARVRGGAATPLLPHHRLGPSSAARVRRRVDEFSRRRRHTDYRGDLMDMTQTDIPGAGAIDSYIGRVDAAARLLPPDRRIELLDQLREHLEAVALAPGATEASVLAAIDRLGDPAEIVASEDGEHTVPAPPSPTPSQSPWGPLEIIAVLLLIVGAFLIPVDRSLGWPGLRLALAGVDQG